MELANVTFQDEKGHIKVSIDDINCIICGRCISACQHEARIFEDDTERFFSDLFAGVPISLITAPAIRSNIRDYKKLFSYLKKNGVKNIYDVSLGADICVWAHIRHLEQNNSVRMITQPCPAIVLYCETYQYELIP
jgi:iron only hydrogenase large subunit-like protein